MDLGLPITIGALALNNAAITTPGGPLVGCSVDSLDYSQLMARQVLNPFAKYDGLDVGGVWVTRRIVQMAGTIYGSTRVNAYTRLAALEAAMMPTSGTQGTTTLVGTYPGSPDLTRTLTVVPQGLRWTETRNSSGGSDSEPLAISWSVTLFASPAIVDV